MDAVLLARIQFALTIGFHYIFPPVTIGLAWLIFIFQSFYLKTNDEKYNIISQFWIKLFGISFAIGVATGITMEFQFGTNWAEYSKFVGDIFGAPLAAEGIIAFFLESSFLGVLIYGVNKVSKKFYWFSTLMVAFGSTLSAFWIIVANSWQQTPQGYEIVNGKAVLTDFWAAVFNSSTIPRYLHSIDGAIITGAFFVLGISSIYLLKNKHMEFAKKSFKIGMIVAFISSITQLGIGHYHAVQVTNDQPLKLAVYEGLWETQANAPILLAGMPDPENEKNNYEIAIPGLLSLLISGSTNTVVQGIKDFPVDERPPIKMTFYTFHLMLILGGYFIAVTALGLILLRKEKVYKFRLLLKALVYSIPLPFIANELGWIAAEVGRQPWIVYNIMKTRDAISRVVDADQILFSIIMFTTIYTVLFVLWIYLLRRKINEGPKAIPA